MTWYAHTTKHADGKPNSDQSTWQPLADHLRNVACLAEKFARDARPDDADFHAAARLAGLLHDLGKYRREFQLYLEGRHAKTEQTRHKQAGAAHACTITRPDIGFSIGGHHGGLPDRVDLIEMVNAPGGTDVATTVWATALHELPELATLIGALPNGSDRPRFDVLTRLLFSCLVDADWSDTSDFHRRAQGLSKEPDPSTLGPASCLANVLRYIGERAASCPDPKMAALRREVLDVALAAADLPPGLFAMTVPTGGGKTLSALAFALSHAARHRLRRIIYVAPYLSIIEQNASEIRKALAADSPEFVLEHHSLAEPPGDPDANEAETAAAARRAENWNAPVVVTTNVQFFESLFANQPGRCRKLHNIARSVVILDECQTLPPGLITPSCAMLNTFAGLTGATFVLCTATQPAWNRREALPDGFTGVREIIPPDANLFERLRRVRLHWPTTDAPRLTWDDVANRMSAARAALCVVNTKPAARKLFIVLQARDPRSALHLSTDMCPAHRLQVLDEVRRRLIAREPCHLVSTQLIEAGVDVDFPLLLREMGPLESVIQAAGRCNREGLLNLADGSPGGEVVVFRGVEGGLPSDHWYKAGVAVVEQDFLKDQRQPDIGQPAHIDEYFRRLYRSGETDAFGIQNHRNAAGFRSVAEKYKLIDDSGVPVVIATWDERREEVADLLKQVEREPGLRSFRRLAPFQVNVPQYKLESLSPMIETRLTNLQIWQGPYDADLGLSRGAFGTSMVV